MSNSKHERHLNQMEDALSEAREMDSKSITCMVQITLTENQIKAISQHHLGMTPDEMQDYYSGKVNGNILLRHSDCTTREDQPDYQYLIDVACWAIAKGYTENENFHKEMQQLKPGLKHDPFWLWKDY